MKNWDSEIIQLLFDCKEAMENGTPSQKLAVKTKVDGFFSSASGIDLQLMGCTFKERYPEQEHERLIPQRPSVSRGPRTIRNEAGFFIADYYLVDDVKYVFVRELNEMEVPPEGAHIADSAIYLPENTK